MGYKVFQKQNQSFFKLDNFPLESFYMTKKNCKLKCHIKLPILGHVFFSYL